MNRTIRLGTFLGLQWSLRPNFIIGFLFLWVVFSLIAYWALGDWATAVWAGLICTDIHWLSDILHQVGHAAAAKSIGYPQKRWIIQHILLATLYPKDEPEIPKAYHWRRALAGVPVSLLLALIASYFAFSNPPASPLWAFVAKVAFWENLLVFGLGALFPADTLLGIGIELDGDTIYKLWQEK